MKRLFLASFLEGADAISNETISLDYKARQKSLYATVPGRKNRVCAITKISTTPPFSLLRSINVTKTSVLFHANTDIHPLHHCRNTPYSDLPNVSRGANTPANQADTLFCTTDMCPVKIHWHVKLNYQEYWRVKVTITNRDFSRNFSDWTLAVQHPNFDNFTEAFSFNYKGLNPYGTYTSQFSFTFFNNPMSMLGLWVWPLECVAGCHYTLARVWWLPFRHNRKRMLMLRFMKGWVHCTALLDLGCFDAH